jgi:integrase
MAKLTTTTTTALAATTSPDRNPALIYLAKLAHGSRRTLKEALNTIAGIAHPGADLASFPWGALRYQHTQAIRSKLAETYSASTANKMLSALRGTLKEAWRLGQMDAEDYQRAIDLDAVRGQKAIQAEKGRHLTQGELSALLGACVDGSNAGARDAAIIAVGYTCGLRRAELAGLLLQDFDAGAGTLTIRRGKGNKERVVPVLNGTLGAVLDWLHVRGPWAGPLFCRVLKGDHVKPVEAISQQTIYDLLARRAEQAGVKAFSPHDLRRTFAGDLLDAGADIATVQQLMGHANVSTTAGYDRRGARAKRDAVNRLHVAYRRQWGE